MASASWTDERRACDAAQHLAELGARLADLELNQARVADLEDRLDFAERLLSQRQELLGK